VNAVMQRRACLLALAGGAAAWPAMAQAQDYPVRPVRLLVPFPPGGTQDLLTRLVAEALAARLGQAVVVENRPGAAGNIGAEALARAPRDGYTLGVLSGVHSANAAFYRKLGYDLQRDFAPVRLVGESAVLIAAGNHVPYRDLAGLIAFAKAHPGQVNFGSTTSLTIDLLRMLTGVEITMVSYKGPGEAMQDAIGGRIDLVAGPAPQLLPLVRDGRIRAIAVAGTRRIAELPQVQAAAETVPGYDAGMWYGVFAPAGTPAAIVARLGDELTRIVRDPVTVARMSDGGVVPAADAPTAAALLARMRTETARWRDVVAHTGNYAN
jgi:tripartite-type tricarboxylate transporter receptor subunit TctC